MSVKLFFFFCMLLINKIFYRKGEPPVYECDKFVIALVGQVFKG